MINNNQTTTNGNITTAVTYDLKEMITYIRHNLSVLLDIHRHIIYLLYELTMISSELCNLLNKNSPQA